MPCVRCRRCDRVGRMEVEDLPIWVEQWNHRRWKVYCVKCGNHIGVTNDPGGLDNPLKQSVEKGTGVAKKNKKSASSELR